MGEINWLDLKHAADEATKPLPNDEYLVEVTKAEYKAAKTGSDMIVVQFTVIQAGPFQGRQFLHRFVLSPDNAFALNRWFLNFAAFGLDDSFWAQQPSLEQVAQTIVGRRAVTKTDQEEYQGNMQTRFTAFKPAGVDGAGGIPTPATAGPSFSNAATPPVPVVPSTGAAVPAGAGAPPTPNF